jgi:putative ABC transport system permease protein
MAGPISTRAPGDASARAASAPQPVSSFAFVFRLAWRDTRTSRRRLLLYAAAITLGIGALVAIASFGDTLRAVVHSQSAAFLGADLVASSGDPFTPEAEAILNSIGGRRANEISFRSMALFPRTGNSRPVRVLAVEDAFPFYGSFETVPVTAAGEFRRAAGALVGRV